MLGHKTATLTLDLYGHLFPDRLDDLADRMDAAVCAPEVPQDNEERARGTYYRRSGVVETKGIEPSTPALQRRCSAN